MVLAKNRMDIELFPGCDFSDVKSTFSCQLCKEVHVYIGSGTKWNALSGH